MTSSSRLRVALPILELLLAPALLLWRVVFGGDVFLPADLLRDIAPWRDAAHLVPWNPLQWDGMAEFYPWRVFYARTLHQGFLPLWNPHQFCGTPFLANGQSAVLYPLNLLFVTMTPMRAFGASVWLHLALTGLLMYGFLRSPALGAGRAAATVGALAWQFSTWQTVWLALPTFLCVSAWLPISLWLTHQLATRPTATRAAALGLVLGLFVLAGHLQIALYCVGLTIAYALFLAVPVLRSDPTRRVPLLAMYALTLALAAGIAAPQILPTLELSRVSHRAGAPVNLTSYAAYVRLAMPGLNLLTLYAPALFGSPTDGTYWGIGTNGGPAAYAENACYIGILTLFLAFAGAVSRARTDRRVRFFVICAAAALLLALGTPLNALPFWTLPGFAQSGSPGRILVLWTFCAAVLAAVGTDAFLSLSRRQGIRTVAVFVGTLAALVVYALIWLHSNAPAGAWQTNLAREPDLWRLPVGIGVGAALCYVLHRRGSISCPAFRGSLAVFVAADLLAAGTGYNRTCRPQDVYPVTPGIAFLQAHAAQGRIMPLNDKWGLYRPPPAIMPPNSATVYGLSDTQGYDSLLTRRYITWAAALNAGPPAPPENGNMVFTNGYATVLAQQADARWLVSRKPLPTPQSQVMPLLRLAYKGNDMFVYELENAAPRAHGATANPVIEDDSVPTRIRLRASGTGPVTLADQWYPGWQTRINNGPWTPTKRDSTIFCAVPLSNFNNSATVEMRYWPAAFRLGLYLFCLTLAAAAGIAAAHSRRRTHLRRRTH